MSWRFMKPELIIIIIRIVQELFLESYGIEKIDKRYFPSLSVTELSGSVLEFKQILDHQTPVPNGLFANFYMRIGDLRERYRLTISALINTSRYLYLKCWCL